MCRITADSAALSAQDGWLQRDVEHQASREGQPKDRGYGAMEGPCLCSADGEEAEDFYEEHGAQHLAQEGPAALGVPRGRTPWALAHAEGGPPKGEVPGQRPA